MQRKIIPVPECARGRVIGKHRGNIQHILEQTGVRVEMDDDGRAHLSGISSQGIEEAEGIISDIIERCTEVASIVPFPVEKKMSIIGYRGNTIEKIRQMTGARIHVSETEARIKGTDEQRVRAKEQIRLVLESGECQNLPDLEGATRVRVPDVLIGSVIGKHGEMLNRIEAETNTQIELQEDGYFSVKGDDIKQQHKAKLRIKEVACNRRRSPETQIHCKKCCFIDGSNLNEDNEFQLRLVDNPHPRWQGNQFKLTLTEGALTQESESLDFSGLSSCVLDMLREVHKKKRDEDGNVAVDMWCHFGYIYIAGVFEDDEHETYDLQQLRKKFRERSAANPGATWFPMLTEGIEELQVEQLERHLSVRPYKVPPNTRYDFSFLTPSCRQIRMKAFVKGTAESVDGNDLQFYEHSPVTMKSVLSHVALSEDVNIYLCAPSFTWLKLDIIIPSRLFDCRLMLRSTLSVIPKTPEEEEEEKILVDYLRESLVVKDGKLVLSYDPPRPAEFDLAYWRRCDRRSYPYSSAGEEFLVMISEEVSEEVEGMEPGGPCRRKTDIHLHCDKWDEMLHEGDWEPQQIVDKLPAFLEFIRSVQQNVSVPKAETQE